MQEPLCDSVKGNENQSKANGFTLSTTEVVLVWLIKFPQKPDGKIMCIKEHLRHMFTFLGTFIIIFLQTDSSHFAEWC